MPRPTGRVRGYFKTRRSNRVGSGGVGNITGRGGSDQEVYGSDRVTLTGPDPREEIRTAKSPGWRKPRYSTVFVNHV